MWNTCSPVRETLNCAQQPPRQKLGLTAQEEAAVDRVEAGDSAVHRGLARPYLSFQNGRRSSQAQALCSQRAKEEKPHRTSRSSSAIARPRLQAPEGREREHGVGWGGVGWGDDRGLIFNNTPQHTECTVLHPNLGISWLLRGSEGSSKLPPSWEQAASRSGRALESGCSGGQVGETGPG